MKLEEFTELLKETAIKRFGIPETDAALIDEDVRLDEAMGLDTLDQLALVMIIEISLKKRLPDEAMLRFPECTVKELYDDIIGALPDAADLDEQTLKRWEKAVSSALRSE